MQVYTQSIHRHTPTLTAADPRNLVARSVAYCRHAQAASTEVRVNCTIHDPAGRAIAQWDPRLFLDPSATANLQTIYSLSGKVLCTHSVDAGLRIDLFGEAGQSLHHWDGRGSQRWMQYDTQLRPESVFEQPLDGKALCTERLSYGASDQASAERNQCGQLIRHDDPAGSQRFAEFGLHGTALEQTRHFLNDLMLPDWPESIADREWLLEPGEGATTRSQVNALGEASHQTDARGHRQLFSQTLDGQLREVRLQLKGEPTPKSLVSAIHYNAHGQTEREVAGNGVITTLEYDAQNGRLTRLQAQRGNEALQDLSYAYDPVGNVLSIKDAALPIRYFANQRIEPVNCYAYDSLSQLIEATGWEAGGANKGPQFSTFDDPAACANFRQQYSYDPGGNLLELTHEGPQSHGHRLVAAAYSNRCLPVLEGVEPGEDDFRRGFDANGNLLNLQPGQTLSWDLRNQLYEVRPVERVSGLNDRERYVYGADGMRLRKVRETLAHARTLIAETRYLPNLELRTYSGTGEVLQVINVQAGRSSVRVLHWESETPKDAANDQYRYHLNDHLGSCTLELDKDGEVISQERYHPFGTTAWFAGRGEVEASYRTVRYSGKERDATGLYYYGFRYYVSGWQRWLNPDPLLDADGLNFYSLVTNNPVNKLDLYGLIGEKWQRALSLLYPETRAEALAHPMLGSKRSPKYVAENLSDSLRITDSSRQFRGVVYFSNEERQAHTVSIINGRVYSTSVSGEKELLTSSADMTIKGKIIPVKTPKTTTALNWKRSQINYVLGWSDSSPINKQLVMYKQQDNKFHHSSAFAGGRVLDAGMMTLYKGRIAFIENKSGHYQPNMEQKIHTLHFLQKEGMDLSSTFISDRIPMVRANPADPDSIRVPDFEGEQLFRADDFYKKRGEGSIFKAPDYDPDDVERFTKQTQVYWPFA
jgi:insecticidal toxin complex protein TccC